MKKGTTLPIKASLSWLACSDTLCVPERAVLTANLTVGDGAPSADGAAAIAKAVARLPKPLPGDAHLARGNGTLSFLLPAAAGLDPAKTHIFPAGDGWFSADSRQHASRSDRGVLIRVATEGSAKPPFIGVVSDGSKSYRVRVGKVAASLPGVGTPASKSDTRSDANGNGAATTNLESGREAGSPEAKATSPATDSAAGTTAAPAGENGPANGPILLTALLGAIIGGLLLNLMPCVFPILSLKALSLARAGADREEARREGLAYAAGSIATALALGSVLLALRAMGQQVGWSFQLQSPHMILVLLILTTAIALNLAGLFEFRAPSLSGGAAMQSGWKGAFATGALAAIIATPCSGPFMAGALGAALVLSPGAALAIFAGLGLGMALPFVAIAWIPALQRRMPKPGGWMETFRRILSLPMFATAIALAWVLGRQTGVGGMTIGLVLAVLGGVTLWWFGHRQRRGARAWYVLVPGALAIAAAMMVELPAPRAEAAPAADALHEPFDTAKLAELRAAGTPVFLDFTADWCMTCKVNEKLAIDTSTTRRAFQQAGVVTMTGDWTDGDPRITRFLADHGRNSIPFYLYYPPHGEPRILPQLLSPELLARQAKGDA
ncbi:thioredoxin family protein [Sphingomonadaceae bacterium LXI357]|uniref:Thioredoxin family protein n=2 Tax=Stakelama marina TaxID=2826939 RepID=A0A8T4IAH9_9SPHN|nr:thioredoxin family protein [Stakelama marina]